MSGEWRYASTLGQRYAMPIYFDSPADAQRHHEMCLRLLKGLPGVDSMRIEELRDGEWVAVGGGEA